MTAPDVLDGRYELQQPLGSGGMAAVYRAWDREGARPCAVKVLADVLARDDAFRRRFRHEAASAGGLTHPRIVTVYGWGQDGLRQFIAMEYVGGGTLQERLQRDGRMAETEALAIAAEVADALAYAHGRHVVHRDIKPHNILLTEDGHVKVADFGIALTLDATSLTRPGTVMGSAPYLSPEQAKGDPAGPASDQYALGIVLYEMLAGRVPFSGEAPVAVALKHLHEAPRSLRDLRPDVSPGTAAVVERLLGKDPRERYPNAAALAAELHRLAGAGVMPAVAAAPDSTGQTGSAAGPAGATVPLDGLAVRPGSSRDGVSAALGLRREPEMPAGPAEMTTALRDLDHLGKTSSLPVVPERPPDAVSGTARLRLPEPRRPKLVAVRLAVVAVCVAFGLTVLAAAYRTAWLAAHVATPNLIGRTVADAGSTAQGLRLGLLVAGKRQDPKAPFGVVVAQDPAPGTDVAKGTVINLTVSEGSGSVPDLRGQTIQRAEGMLERVGLRLGQVSYTFDDQVTSGRIIYQFQLPGAQLGPNAGVDVLVSQGTPPFPFGPGAPGLPGLGGPKGAGDHEHGH
ncbi:MAG TPA: protein kinase [bacterium]|nr:protein kinase [bacterium]